MKLNSRFVSYSKAKMPLANTYGQYLLPCFFSDSRIYIKKTFQDLPIACNNRKKML